MFIHEANSRRTHEVSRFIYNGHDPVMGVSLPMALHNETADNLKMETTSWYLYEAALPTLK